MTTGTAASSRSNLLLPPVLLLFALAYGLAILAAGKLALLGLVGALFFILFVNYPVLGLYATAALLLLQGSAGILGTLNQDAPLAITLAQLAGLAALAAWIANTLVRKAQFAWNWPIALLCAFLVWSLFSTLLSPYGDMTFPHWVRLLARLGFFLLAVNTLTTAKTIRTYVYVLLVCTLAMAGLAVLQYFLPQWHITGAEAWGTMGAVDAAYVDQESLVGEAAIRVSGRAGHSNWLAMILLLVLPLNAYWYTIAKSARAKVFVACAVLVELMALTFTFTRTGLLIGTILAVLLLVRRLLRVSPQRIFGGLLVLVLVWVALPSAYKERVLSPKQYVTSKSVMSRIDMQEAALRFFFQNPVLGLGMGGFGAEFIRGSSETAKTMHYMVHHQGWQPVFLGTHNMYLQLLCDTGFFGFLFFVGFYFLMLRELYRLEQRFKSEGDTHGEALAGVLFVSLVGFALCAIFLHALHREIWWMVAACAVALCVHRPSFAAPPKAPAA